MTTPAKKPYHKKRHPWKDQDLRSDAKRAAEGQKRVAPKLCIEIVEFDTDKVERKLGPFASVHLRDKADSGLQQRINHERYYTRFTT